MEIFEKIKQRSHEQFGDNFKYNFSTYKNGKEKMEIICKKHGSFQESIKNHMRKQYGCDSCKEDAMKADFLQKAKEKHGDKYVYDKVIYKNQTTKVKIFCKNHKKYFYQEPSKHMHDGNGCPKCAHDLSAQKLTQPVEKFLKELELIHPPGRYDYSKINFKGIKYNIHIICNSCGGNFSMKAYHHRRGQGCPRCASSKGEMAIMSFLEINNIIYEKEKTFENLKDKGLLRYDFYIPEKNLLIEFDGIQHFQPVMFNGSDEEKAKEMHKNVVRKDKIKNNYAIQNGIKLKRIGYKQLKNIPEILKKLFL